MTQATHFMRDIQYAARALRREPGFSAAVAITLALAIGANASMFGIVRRLMFAPPPGIASPGEIARASLNITTEDGETFPMSSLSWPAYVAMASQNAVVAGAAAYQTGSVTAGNGEDASQIAVTRATGNWFSLLGVRPAAGRFFGESDDAPPNGSPVAVLGHAYWKRQFGGAMSVIGARIELDGEPFTIIGVAPPQFNGLETAPVDLYLPIHTAAAGQPADWLTNARMNIVTVFARVRSGVTVEMAARLLTAGVRNDARASRNELVTVGLEPIVPGASARSSAQARIALWLAGVSLIVLIVATANAGTMLLLRATRRRRDSAVRMTLGARRSALARHAITESVMLALVAGALGAFIARWFGAVVRATLLPNVAAAERLFDPAIVLMSFGAALVAGLLAGLIPITQLRDASPIASIRDGGSNASARAGMQRALVGFQVALCTLLLVGAGLFVRSLQRVRAQDLGFSTARLLYVSLDFRGRPRGAERDDAHRAVAQRLAALPGLSGVTTVEGMPFASHHIPPIAVPGVPPLQGRGLQLPIMYGATPTYLRLMNVALREGRLFSERDNDAHAPLVVLVNESMARTIWPGQSAIGKCVKAGYGPAFSFDGEDSPAETAPCRAVIGVVKDSRARLLRAEGNEAKIMQYYVPMEQIPAPPFPGFAAVHGLLVQSADDHPERIALAVKRAIQATSPLPVFANVRPYQDLLDPQLRSWRLGATMLTAVGMLALGIAAIGLSGVISYFVVQRTQEIGVRLALGGSPNHVGGRVLLSALQMGALGAAAGVIAAAALAPLVRPLLFQTSPHDMTTYLVSAGALIAVSLVAAALPALRASKLSPMIALRSGG
jgi:predicted permease